MKYRCPAYPQLHGSFTPYVSILDLLFNVGLEAAAGYLGSECTYWRDWPFFSNGRPVAAPVAAPHVTWNASAPIVPSV
jgi:hypothetical protein